MTDNNTDKTAPSWVEELRLGLAVAPQLMLTGNVADIHLAPNAAGEWAGLTTEQMVTDLLTASGYQLVMAHDTVAGLRVLVAEDPNLAHVIGGQVMDKASLERNRYGGILPDKTIGDELFELARACAEASAERDPRARITQAEGNANPRLTDAQLSQLVYAVARCAWPCALLLEHAGWLAQSSPEQPTRETPFRPSEGPEVFRVAVKLCADAPELDRVDCGGRQLYNPIIWITRQLHDLPTWLTGLSGWRRIAVPPPEREDRRDYAKRVLGQRFAGFAALDESGRDAFAEELGGQTDGLALADLRALGDLANDSGFGVDQSRRAVSVLKFGVGESPWRRPELAERIKDDGCYNQLRSAIFGQDQALRAAARCVNKAVLGFSALGAESSPHRPKGVLFLAGPTGTGKTELAKQLAQFVFGTEESVTRFDMSEYSSAHSETRLIGAPPAYVGYDAGGQLTDRVRDKPFSLLLFDEIEKAHPQILDKFLQVLDDGRLTDGKGATVFFSETLIVFTSNLGVTEVGADGLPVFKVTPGDAPERVEAVIRQGVESHFTQIARPELYGRLAKGIVVLGFVGPDGARAIARKALDSLAQQIDQLRPGAVLELAPEAEAALMDHAAAPDSAERPSLRRYGGRRIQDMVDAQVMNPIQEALIRFGADSPPRIAVRLAAAPDPGAPPRLAVTIEELNGDGTV
ncbi:MAG: AAA family ATPase [Bifidobacteriaceae bacterium]|jgi:hypothetical protein|nr:AAA family ATPase [Bifidobacteriaceae bacterium]